MIIGISTVYQYYFLSYSVVSSGPVRHLTPPFWVGTHCLLFQQIDLARSGGQSPRDAYEVSNHQTWSGPTLCLPMNRKCTSHPFTSPSHPFTSTHFITSPIPLMSWILFLKNQMFSRTKPCRSSDLPRFLSLLRLAGSFLGSAQDTPPPPPKKTEHCRPSWGWGRALHPPPPPGNQKRTKGAKSSKWTLS